MTKRKSHTQRKDILCRGISKRKAEMMYLPHNYKYKPSKIRDRIEAKRLELRLPICHTLGCIMIKGTRCTECNYWW